MKKSVFEITYQLGCLRKTKTIMAENQQAAEHKLLKENQSIKIVSVKMVGAQG